MPRRKSSNPSRAFIYSREPEPEASPRTGSLHISTDARYPAESDSDDEEYVEDWRGPTLLTASEQRENLERESRARDIRNLLSDSIFGHTDRTQSNAQLQQSSRQSQISRQEERRNSGVRQTSSRQLLEISAADLEHMDNLYKSYVSNKLESVSYTHLTLPTT
jgi:hypothetical protein